MPRQVNEEGIALIKKWEGFRNAIYKDTAGNLTIGIGHKILPGEDFSAGLSDEEVLSLFQSDTAKAEDIIAANIDVPLTDNQFGALVCLVFNCGARPLCGGLGDCIEDNDSIGIADEWLRWDHIRRHDMEIESNSLLARRRDELALFQDKDDKK